MSGKDLEIRTTIEHILENNSHGRRLKEYFGGLPDARIRRAIGILSGIYPDRTTISDDDFSFVVYLFSNVKFIGQLSFWNFVSAVNILNFTEPQKKRLIDAIQNNIELLCATCTCELDTLLANLFEPDELVRYLEVLAETGSRPVLEHVADILRHEDFSNSSVPDERIEALKRKISKAIHR